MHKDKLQIDERPQCETGIHQFLEESMGSNLYGTGQCNLFHDTSPKARETKDKMNMWDVIKIKASAQPKKQ